MGTLAKYATVGVGIILVCALVWAVISALFAGNVINILHVYEAGKPIGIILITPHDKLDKDVRNQWPHSIGAQYESLIDNVKIPADGSQKIFKNFPDIDIERCGEPMSVGLLSRAWKPKLGSAKAGIKVALEIIGLRAIGRVGCEEGELEPGPGYNANFTPVGPGTSIWNSGQCIIRMFVLGQKFSESSCLDSGYEPYDNFYRSAPGLYGVNTPVQIVMAYSNGAWVIPLNSQTKQMLQNTAGVNTGIVDWAWNFQNNQNSGK